MYFGEIFQDLSVVQQSRKFSNSEREYRIPKNVPFPNIRIPEAKKNREWPPYPKKNPKRVMILSDNKSLECNLSWFFDIGTHNSLPGCLGIIVTFTVQFC